MRKLFTASFIICMLITLAACNMDGEEVHSFLSGLAENLGESQITKDQDLIGTRTLTEDAYTGRYQAQSDGITGRDIVFGGGSINSRSLHLYGVVHSESGSAVVRIRQNEEVTQLPLEEDGRFETTLTCSSGGNYIMIDYKNFHGDLELYSEYLPHSSE